MLLSYPCHCHFSFISSKCSSQHSYISGPCNFQISPLSTATIVALNLDSCQSPELPGPFPSSPLPIHPTSLSNLPLHYPSTTTINILPVTLSIPPHPPIPALSILSTAYHSLEFLATFLNTPQYPCTITHPPLSTSSP